MTHPEQERVFRMIPGLERADFVRLGSIHRNTYLDSPRVLDHYSRAKACTYVFFAGQITGVEGYIESTASGLAVGIMAAFLWKGLAPVIPPSGTAIGALLKHTRDMPTKRKFEPMNVNFGIIDPPPPKTPKKQRKEVVVERALSLAREWKATTDGLWTQDISSQALM
jgi:methylenetetrahydrofolate--tRNA-(uracil-5-)-methyltransferase